MRYYYRGIRWNQICYCFCVCYFWLLFFFLAAEFGDKYCLIISVLVAKSFLHKCLTVFLICRLKTTQFFKVNNQFESNSLNHRQMIIIMSFRLHGFPWPYLAIRLYRPSRSAGLPGYILYQYRAVVDRFLPVAQPLLIRLMGSTGKLRLWVCPYLSSSVPYTHIENHSKLDREIILFTQPLRSGRIWHKVNL